MYLKLLKGIATGDALGATSEFYDRQQVILLYGDIYKKGWPFKQYGDIRRKIKVGGWTDDTEMAIQLIAGNKNPNEIAKNFVNWKNSNPIDIGGTTKLALTRLERHDCTPFWIGGYETYRLYPEMLANGSLMRNGVVDITNSLTEAYDLSLEHGMITHFAPLSQICCMAQTYIEWSLVHKKFNWNQWTESFKQSIEDYLKNVSNSNVKNWIKLVGDDLERSEMKFFAENWDVSQFNPYLLDLKYTSGYCVMTLKIAMWGLYHATHNTQFTASDKYPSRVFRAVGPDRLGWVAMLGYDSDTYCAVAGPMMVAAGLKFSKDMSLGIDLPHDIREKQSL